MAGWLTKLVSGLDFWDEDENKKQRAQFAREDEEERKRRAEEAARKSVSRPAPMNSNQPNIPGFDTPLKRATAGSQSDFMLKPGQKPNPADPLGIMGKNDPFANPLKPVVPPMKAPEPAKPKGPLPDKDFMGLDNGEKEEKKIFGMGVSGILGDKYGYRTKVKVGRTFQTNQDKYVAQFDTLDDERKKLLVNEMKKKAANRVGEDGKEIANTGDLAAINSIKALQDSGRLKGNIMDFIEGSNDKLYGGLARATARTTDFVLPGDQGLDKWADKDAEANAAYTDAGKMGEKFGSVQKGIVDIATIVLPQSAIDKGVKGMKIIQTLENGSKIANIGGKLVSIVPGSVAGTGIDMLQQNGRGEEVDVVKSAGIGIGTDLAVEAAGGPLARFIKKGKNLFKQGAKSGVIDDAVEEGVGLATAGSSAGARSVEDFAEEALDARKLEKALESGAKEEASVIPSKVEKEVSSAAPTVEVAPGVKSTNLAKEVPDVAEEVVDDAAGAVRPSEVVDETGTKMPTPASQSDVRIPNPADNIALARVDDAASVAEDVPVAKFDDGIDVDTPLQPVANVADEVVENAPPVVNPTESELMQQADELAPAVDEAGNPVVQTDAQRAQELADQGVATTQEASVAATKADELEQARQEAIQEEVNLGDVSAPETRQQILQRIDNDEIIDDLATNAPRKETINLEEAQINGTAKVREWGDDEVVTQFENGFKVEDPESFHTALAGLNRLDAIDTSELTEEAANKVIQARRQAFESMADYAEQSGRGLRTVQVVFDDMPSTMKVEYLMKKLSNAGVDDPDAVRQQLTNYITQADAATTTLRSLEETAQKTLTDIETGAFKLTPESKKGVNQLANDIKEATRFKENKAGDAYKFWKSNMPKGPLGKQAGQWGRTLMLSSPGGRVFDLISTASTFFDDLATQSTSALLGKGVNAVTRAPGKVIDTMSSPTAIVKGGWEGVKDTWRAIQGKDRVDDFMGAAKRSSRGDTGDLDNWFANAVRGIVELPTNLTRGMFDNKLFAQGMQEAKKAGLKGEAAQAYGMLRAVVPSKAQLAVAKDAHLRVNMLHENPVSRGLNRVANSLDNNGKASWLTPTIRNQVAPFTSWLGGNMHRTLTDKNVLYNVYDIGKQLFRQNPQGAIDSAAKLAVNTGEAFAAGTLLYRSGLLVDHNETTDEGDDYAGLYFKLPGDRYVPVSILGTASVPIILGHSAGKAMDNTEENGGDFMDTLADTTANSLVNTAKNMGVSGVFGGDNNLQRTVSDVATDNGGTPQDEVFNPLIKAGANAGRQYIPGFTGDINSILDTPELFGAPNPLNLNPTGEAAKTKQTYTNPETGREKTDVPATEWNKTLSKIPIVSQKLERDEGKAAKDPLDKMLKSSRGTPTQAEERAKAQTEEDKKKARAKDDIPDKAEDLNNYIQARTEEANYDSAIKGLNQKYEDIKDDNNVPKSKKMEMETDIKRLEITRDGGYDPRDIELYSKISLSEWQKLADPDSSPEEKALAKRLQEYDQKMASAGVSRDEDDPKSTKYYAKGDGSKRGGKGSGSGKKMSTDIATNKQSFDSFSPLKPMKASMAAPQSSVPEVDKVPLYSRKLKKISVSKGGRA